MIYTVKCDNEILYNQYIADRTLVESEWNQIDNEAGSFTFSIYDDHPLYGSIVPKKSRIKIYRDGVLKWLGRPSEVTDEIDGMIKVYCEGCLSYFNDSVMEPFEFSGAPNTFFSAIINKHNSRVSEDQQFIVGECTVTDPNDYIVRSSQSYNRTWKVVTEKMLNMGGHLIVTFDENEQPILNWLATISNTSSQHIKFGQNLVEYERSFLYSEFYTACVPLGAQDETTGKRLTIKAANDGIDYLINTALAATYGIIYADPEQTVWDDVTLAANLKTKGLAWLSDVGVKYKKVINLTAEDISFLMADVSNAELDFMTNVVFDTLSGAVATYLVVNFNVDVRDPYSLQVVISDDSVEYAESSLSKSSQRDRSSVIERIGSIESDYVTNEEMRETATTIANEQIEASTYIEQKVNGIILEALQRYTKTSDFNSFQSTVLSQLAILPGAIDANFMSATGQISTLNDKMNSEFNVIYSFIRLLAELQEGGVVTQEGGIVIGKSTSDIKLKLQNDVLYFFVGDEKIVDETNAIAWFKSNQLYVNTSSIQNLTLGTQGAYLDAKIVGSGDNICVLWSGRLAT